MRDGRKHRDGLERNADDPHDRVRHHSDLHGPGECGRVHGAGDGSVFIFCRRAPPLSTILADASSRFTACPTTGFASFTPGVGRTLVSATASIASGFSPTPDGAYLNSPTSTPTHAHTVSGLSVGTKSMTTGCGANYAPSSSVSGSTGGVDPLPGTTAAVCRSNDGSTSASDLPAGAHLFFAKTSCPSDFLAADTTFNGRLIVGTPSGGTVGTVSYRYPRPM